MWPLKPTRSVMWLGIFKTKGTGHGVKQRCWLESANSSPVPAFMKAGGWGPFVYTDLRHFIYSKQLFFEGRDEWERSLMTSVRIPKENLI